MSEIQSILAAAQAEDCRLCGELDSLRPAHAAPVNCIAFDAGAGRTDKICLFRGSNGGAHPIRLFADNPNVPSERLREIETRYLAARVALSCNLGFACHRALSYAPVDAAIRRVARDPLDLAICRAEALKQAHGLGTLPPDVAFDTLSVLAADFAGWAAGHGILGSEEVAALAAHRRRAGWPYRATEWVA